MKDELIRMEEGFWRAAGNAGFYRDHFAEDGRCVFAFGTMDKSATIAAVESAAPWSSFTFEDVQVTPLADDVASLTYAARADRAGEGYRARVSSVYIRRGRGWELILHQQTPAASSSGEGDG